MSPGVKLVERLIRAVELQLTGESHFAFITSELRDFDVVDDRIKARRLLEATRLELARELRMELKAPVILELVDPESAEARRGSHDLLGFYRPQPWGEKAVHTIYIRSGLERRLFCGIAAHEMAHAWERERGCLTTHRALREGFARWVEYKVLHKHGAKREAERLLRIRSWRLGRALRELLVIEEQVGMLGVPRYIESLR